MTSSRRILLLRIVALIALLVSGALTADSFHTERGFCPLQAACKAARSSALGHVMGVPTSIVGLVAFAGLLGLTFLPARTARKVLRPVGLLAALCGAGLLGYQAVVLKSFCPLCLVADGMGLATGILTLTWRPELAGRHARFPRESVVGRLRWALAAGTVVAVPLVWPQPAPRPAWVPVPEDVDEEVASAPRPPTVPVVAPTTPPAPAAPASPAAPAALAPATPAPHASPSQPVVMPAPLPLELPPSTGMRIPPPTVSPLPASYFAKSGVTAALAPTPRPTTPPPAPRAARATPTSPVPATPTREVASVPLAPPAAPPPAPREIAVVPPAPPPSPAPAVPPEPPSSFAAGPVGPPPEPAGAPDAPAVTVTVAAATPAAPAPRAPPAPAPTPTPPAAATPSPAATSPPAATPPPPAATPPPAPPAAAPREVRLVEYLNAYCAHCRATHARLDRVLAMSGIAVKRRRLYVWVSGEAPYWARACVAAAGQGKEDALFEELQRAESEDPDEVLTAARRAGLDAPALIAAIQRGEGMPRLKTDRQKVLGAHLEGLPTFDIGHRRLEGEQSEAELEDALRAAAAALAAR